MAVGYLFRCLLNVVSVEQKHKAENKISTL